MEMLGDINDSVLDVFGQQVTFSGVSVSAIFTQQVVGIRHGPHDAQRPAIELLVRSADLSGVNAAPRSPVEVSGKNYIVVSREPDDGDMTRLVLRGST
jgi:hypothetical protein